MYVEKLLKIDLQNIAHFVNIKKKTVFGLNLYKSINNLLCWVNLILVLLYYTFRGFFIYD